VVVTHRIAASRIRIRLASAVGFKAMAVAISRSGLLALTVAVALSPRWLEAVELAVTIAVLGNGGNRGRESQETDFHGRRHDDCCKDGGCCEIFSTV